MLPNKSVFTVILESCYIAYPTIHFATPRESAVAVLRITDFHRLIFVVAAENIA